MNYFFNLLFSLPRRLRSIIFQEYNRVKFFLIGIKCENLSKIHVNTHIYIHIFKGASVKIGSPFNFTSGDNLNPLSRNIRGCIVAERHDTKIFIGNHVRISSSCIWAKEKIVIGNYVNIGADCILMDSNAHSMDWRLRMTCGYDDIANAKCAAIVIEDNVMIGTRCIILKGVTIGARSVIAAGSVVTKSIPPDCVAGGNPCKIIKTIYNDD